MCKYYLSIATSVDKQYRNANEKIDLGGIAQWRKLGYQGVRDRFPVANKKIFIFSIGYFWAMLSQAWIQTWRFALISSGLTAKL